MHKNKEKVTEDNKEEIKTGDAVLDNNTESNQGEDSQKTDSPEAGAKCSAEETVRELNSQLETKSKQFDEVFLTLQRTAAEFDNYKKRTAREKEALYYDSIGEVAGAFLPVADNLERALAAGNEESQGFKDGVRMILKQFGEACKKLGIEEIEAIGSEFDPQLHNAVMHIEDENAGHNVVVEEFQKGYRIKDKVIRHSMVKVAN